MPLRLPLLSAATIAKTRPVVGATASATRPTSMVGKPLALRSVQVEPELVLTAAPPRKPSYQVDGVAGSATTESTFAVVVRCQSALPAPPFVVTYSPAVQAVAPLWPPNSSMATAMVVAAPFCTSTSAIWQLSNTVPPSLLHVAPASVLRYRPVPKYESGEALASPVPA